MVTWFTCINAEAPEPGWSQSKKKKKKADTCVFHILIQFDILGIHNAAVEQQSKCAHTDLCSYKGIYTVPEPNGADRDAVIKFWHSDLWDQQLIDIDMG